MNEKHLKNDIAELEKKAVGYKPIAVFSLCVLNKKAKFWRISIFASLSIILASSAMMALQKARSVEASKSYAQDTNGRIAPITPVNRVTRRQG